MPGISRGACGFVGSGAAGAGAAAGSCAGRLHDASDIVATNAMKRVRMNKMLCEQGGIAAHAAKSLSVQIGRYRIG